MPIYTKKDDPMIIKRLKDEKNFDLEKLGLAGLRDMHRYLISRFDEELNLDDLISSILRLKSERDNPHKTFGGHVWTFEEYDPIPKVSQKEDKEQAEEYERWKKKMDEWNNKMSKLKDIK